MYTSVATLNSSHQCGGQGGHREAERERYTVRTDLSRDTGDEGKEYNKDMQMWNFTAIGPLSKLTIPLAVPKIKDHF